MIPLSVSACLCVDGSARSELDMMVNQVLSVLPRIPASVVRQDLGMCITLSLT